MNYQQARIFCISAIIIIVLFSLGALVRCVRGDKADGVSGGQPADSITLSEENFPHVPEIPLKFSNAVGNLSQQFSDLNDAHLIYAKKLGIKPIQSTADILKIDKEIVEIETCENYTLDKLTHSYPFLVPEAAELLDTIGARFNRKLAEQNGGDYKIKVTSLLRTEESVNRLKRNNVNSTENSAHLYGTTFDISYVKFTEGEGNAKKHNDGSLKNLLADVLIDLREHGKCKVKYEHKQGCFHITATGL